jgi:hypothetical protein
MARVNLPIETDAASVTELGRDALRAAFPGIQFPAAGLLTALTAAGGEMAAYGRDALAEHDDFIYERLGTTILGIPYQPALPAAGASTWTLVDTDGWTIPAGTEITLRGLDDSRVGFEVVADVTIASGDSATAAGEVLLRAIVPGAAGDGLTGDPQMENGFTRLASIVMAAPTAGGVDAQDQDEYLDDLREEQRVAIPALVSAADAELLARRVAGVDRALVLDTYDPDTATFGNPGLLTIAAIDAAGAGIGPTVKTALAAYLDLRRISGLDIRFIDPTSTTLNFTYVAIAHDGYDPATVKATADAALADTYSPANYGLPYSGDERRWINRPIVRYRDVVTLIESVDGLDYTSPAPLVNGGTADVTLTGAAPLPSVGTITSTVTAP